MNIGFVGFGEAAFELSKGLKNHNDISISAYDPLMNHSEMGEKLIEKASSVDVELLSSLKELVSNKLEVLIVAVPANKAIDVGSEISEILKNEIIYVDISASTPQIQKEIEQKLHSVTKLYVDASILGPLTKFKHKVPIVISGNGSDALTNKVTGFDMNITKISDNAGDASAIKLIRSIFMKGLATLSIETLEIGRQMNVEKHVIQSLDATLGNEDLIDTFNQLITGTAIHSERRSVELEGSLTMLKELNINADMSEGALKKLQYVTDYNLREYFDAERPDSWERVIDTITKLRNE